MPLPPTAPNSPAKSTGTRASRSLLAGVVLGAVFQSALAVAYSALSAPVTFQNGKYAIVFFFTVLFGGVAGAFAGTVYAARKNRDNAAAKRTAFAASGVLLGLSTLIVYHARNTSVRAQDFIVSPLYGMIAVWGAVFLLAGVYFTVTEKKGI